MRVMLTICLGVAAACVAVVLHGVVWDVVGAAVAIGALAVVTRSVIGLAGDAGTPRDSGSALRRDPHLE
jgi:hypothetical protein